MTDSDLSTLNSTTLGATFPEITLPDGSKVQTGTIGALLSNIKRYDNLTTTLSHIPGTRPGDRHKTRGELESLEQAFRLAIPLLFQVGMFDLFPPEEWINGGGGANGSSSSSAGRKRVGELAEEWLREKGGEVGEGEK